MLVYKLSPTEPGEKQSDGPYDDDTGRKGRPGVTAGIALGSISGFALLAFLIFLGARTYKKRRLQQASGSDEHGSGIRDGEDASKTPLASSRASLGNTNRVDLRKVGPIVMDFAPLAASTGAEWRAGNPGTPRAAEGAIPKPATDAPRNDDWEDIPNTPTILVQQPDNVAQNPGLGERAWHRRRLSIPLPPAGYQDSNGDSATRGWDSQEEAGQTRPQSTGYADSTSWEDTWDELMPAPLTLPPLGGGAGASSAPSEEDGGPLTAKTMWTVPSDPSLSGSSGKSMEKGGKTGKAE